MATLSFDNNYDHVIEAAAGSDGMHDLLFSDAAPAAGQTFDRGALVHLNSDGELEAGCGDCQMPMWTKHAYNDYDLSAETAGISGENAGCFVGTGGFELYTTEYVTSETYTYNTALTAATGDDAGKVEPSPTAYNSVVMVGLVSRGTDTGNYSQNILYFWPMFIPKIVTA